MRVNAVVLDTRPGYLSGPASSLLLMPVGRMRLIEQLRQSLEPLRPAHLIVAPDFPFGNDYLQALAATGAAPDRVVAATTFRGLFKSFEASDWLMLIDPCCYPAHGFDLRGLLADLELGPQWARHLVPLKRATDGTEEHVQLEPDGRVRRIQRYYARVTWHATVGVSASLLPAASLWHAPEISTLSPVALRRALVSQGVPSRDLPLEGGAYDLREEAGLLGLSERMVLASVLSGGDTSPPGVSRFEVHSSARVIGPVCIHDDAVIGEEAVVVGPSCIGPGARIGARSQIVHSLIAPGAELPAGSSVQHRVVHEPGPPPQVDEPAPARRPFPGVRAAEPSSTLVPLQGDRPASAYLRYKWIGESLLALLALLALSPLLLLTALLVKLDSRGPVLYGDEREGRGGRTFRCWKFRTMVSNAHALQAALRARNAVDGPQFKLVDDPRVTRLGRWLRRANVDELPQLFNVLFGQMSFVGPRPSPFRENQICIPWRQGRLSVRPGITGLWQICRHDRARGDFHQWIYYDLLYVRHASLWLDLKILVGTVVTLGGQRPAPLAWLVKTPEPRTGAASAA